MASGALIRAFFPLSRKDTRWVPTSRILVARMGLISSLPVSGLDGLDGADAGSDTDASVAAGKVGIVGRAVAGSWVMGWVVEAGVAVDGGSGGAAAAASRYQGEQRGGQDRGQCLSQPPGGQSH